MTMLAQHISNDSKAQNPATIVRAILALKKQNRARRSHVKRFS
jgi:hypothetical protein